MGRSRRVTRMINYNETRTYTPSSAGIEEIGEDRGQTQNTSQWGWSRDGGAIRSNEAMVKSSEADGASVFDKPTKSFGSVGFGPRYTFSYSCMVV